MKKISLATAALVAGSLLVAGGAMAQAQPGRMAPGGTGMQQQQQMGQQPMGQQMGQQQVKAVDELKNFSLRDQQGQNIGEIDQVLVDLQQGQIGYIVVEAQGQSHVIPWNALRADAQQQSLTLQISADRFRQAPTGDAQMVQDMEQARQIHQFYGVSPYWEEGATRPMIDQRMQRQQEQIRDRSPVQERMEGIEQRPMQQQQR
jgi:sporulation protein YlmC with PRC-barrel domain